MGAMVADSSELAWQNVVIVLGCAVRAGGVPSPAMRRRVNAALRLEQSLEGVLFIPVGGVGKFGPAEAVVIERLLRQAGVASVAIHAVPEGRNTIHSLRACWPVLMEATADLTRAEIYVCTDRYHLLRCRAILRIWGALTRGVTRQRSEESAAERSAYMFWRDGFALAKDVPRAAWWRMTHQVSVRR